MFPECRSRQFICNDILSCDVAENYRNQNTSADAQMVRARTHSVTMPFCACDWLQPGGIITPLSSMGGCHAVIMFLFNFLKGCNHLEVSFDHLYKCAPLVTRLSLCILSLNVTFRMWLPLCPQIVKSESSVVNIKKNVSYSFLYMYNRKSPVNVGSD